jgi:hypothetical protein
MTVRANFNAHIALVRRTRLELVTASANHTNFFVGGVDSGFHNNVLGNLSLPYLVSM